ncbi:MAG: 5-deoxy-glucuronate isomerase [Acidobacteriota bacterium]
MTFRQRFVPETANLQFLSGGEYELLGSARSGVISLAWQESLLFLWQGSVQVELWDSSHQLMPYDTLYVPRGVPFRLINNENIPAKLFQASAPAENVHPVVHSRFDEISRRQDRIRRLKGKDVYLMFDVSEGADKLLAGYTFFQPHQRSWPPHNHTDQEEVYIFIKGQGAMEVYASPETLSFVHSVREGDMVTIPSLNYHPVFSQKDPLEFIWCIAGERYWIGDKNRDFMNGNSEAITT